MKLAFSTLGCPNWSLEKIANAALEFGYDGVELRGLQGEFNLPKCPQFQPPRIEETKKLFSQKGIEIVCLSSSARFALKEEAERKSNVEQAKDYIKLAKDLNAPLVRVFGGTIPEGLSRERAFNYVAECLSEVGEFAEKYGVKVAVETHDSFVLGKDLFLLLNKVQSPAVGALWDVNHPFRHGEEIEDTMRYLKDHLIHVHIKDSKTKDGSFGYVFLGEGEVPVFEILRLIKEAGYNGYLSLEWEKAWVPDLAEPEVAFPQYSKKLREYLAKI